MIGKKIMFRVRMGSADVHYGEGQLVAGSKMLDFFGDLGTELCIRYDGDESLFRSYSSVDFLEPVYLGDIIEYYGWIEKTGKSSRTCRFEAYKVVELAKDPKLSAFAANVLPEPLLVGTAVGTLIVKKEFQRGAQDPDFENE